MNRKGIVIAMGVLMTAPVALFAQTEREEYEAFRARVKQQYSDFRDDCNSKYADFLAKSWENVKIAPAIPKPQELPPVPPRPYDDRSDNRQPIDVTPYVIPTPDTRPVPQPSPVFPIEEEPFDVTRPVRVAFYELTPQIRVPDLKLNLGRRRPEDVANAWKTLSSNSALRNTIRDCLETRSRYALSDWAYLQFLDKLARSVTRDANEATFLMAYLFCQSGYQMRLAEDNGKIHMLFGSRHIIFNKPRYNVNGVYFYPYGENPNQLFVANTIFDGETPMSFVINTQQNLGNALSEPREIRSKKYPEVAVTSRVPVSLLKFYNDYPDSKYGDNFMSQWAIYANTPMAEATRAAIYPALLNRLEGLSKKEKVERLLNLVQTAFRYDYDTNVWGEERAFFAEETLYYPFSDCEDRAILFSRLVRDLVGLPVALVYYPGHLAAAVCFDEQVPGDAMMINGRRFVIADPTFVNAPVGKQMPDLEHNKAQAIVL